MRKLVIVMVVLVAAAYGLPLANESASTPCNALERRFVSLATPGDPGADPGVTSFERAIFGGLQGFSNGSFAIEYVRREHPNLPAGVACVVEYWRSYLPGNRPRPRAN